MTNKALSIFNQLRPLSVGFDDMFDHFENMFEVPTMNYPPYNIVKTGDNKFNIEVALAGFNKKDIKITSENNMLVIESINEVDKKDKNGEVIHKGISQRYFKRSFTIADDVEVKGAELKDGLLKVSMEKIIPDAKKLKTINIK
ncbi:MAG: heat-shock protein [Candidatus Marinimicrobia bacterium]|nr:heat-shock protein [Candidatus Neomarinimicrobiota bacterium]